MAEQEQHRIPQSGQHEHHLRSHSEAEAAAGIVPAHGISINFPDSSHTPRPHPVKHMSAPTYQSPIRHHRRAPSKTKGVKETLNARSHYGSSDDDGASVHRINQYIVKQEIGRGSFGSVHLAADQYGNEYAVKEFSKSRLRKRAQSNLLRKPNFPRRPGHLAAGLGFNSPLHRHSSSDRMDAGNNSLELIKEEIAIMKKLNHNNLVSLIEVLDDPQEDSLYMVLEMCKKGVVMKVGLEERAEPYAPETCRCWFRDMILGIEYLHAQGVVHRDIKPDNCLITEDDVLKIVDFGVSEMFEKQSDMHTAKSAGSPAFMPPELCVARHGQVSGRAADIWSMGVTLYCLRYGHIPFEKGAMLELYDSIRNDDIPLDGEQDRNFEDLIRRILEKDSEKRITMEELRNHPWVTKNGTDPLLSAEENCADLVELPTQAEMDHAITGNMAHLMVVMKAVKRFKTLLHRKRPGSMQGIFGRNSRLVAPPNAIRERAGKSVDAHDRRPMDSALVTGGVHRDVEVDDEMKKLPHNFDRVHLNPAEVNIGARAMHGPEETEAIYKQRMETNARKPHHPSEPSLHRSTTLANEAEGANLERTRTFPQDDHAKGQAHDPLSDTLFLDIGASADEPGTEGEQHFVSESPPAVELNIYEQAYQDEMKKILERRGKSASMYLTRRVEHRDDLRSHSSIVDSTRDVASAAKEKLAGLAGKRGGAGGLASLVKAAKEQKDDDQPQEKVHEPEKQEGEKESSEESEEPPLHAPQYDGSSEAAPQTNGDTLKVPDSIMKAQAHVQAQLDAAKGAMPGMPGGFPVSPGLTSEGSTA